MKSKQNKSELTGLIHKTKLTYEIWNLCYKSVIIK